MQPDCTTKPGPLQRAVLAMALALCVLAGQAGVATHDLGHALERLGTRAASGHPLDGIAASDACHPDQGDGGGCPLHALFTELASIAFGSWPAVAAEPASHCLAVIPDAPALPAARVAFRSRAPPVVLA